MLPRIPEKERILECLSPEGLVELAQALIAIDSPSGQESEAARFLEQYMRDHGLETEMMEVEPGRFQPIGRIRGTGGGCSLMFNGHMDTEVPTLGENKSLTPRIEDGRLFGHGIYNMKSGVAAMVAAAVAVKKAGIALKGDLIVTPVVGELQGSVGTATLVKRGVSADYGLVPEPYDEVLCLTHAGEMEMAITLRGHSVHCGDRENGIDLAAKLARVIDAINTLELTYTPDARFPAGPKKIIGSIVCGRGDDHSLKGGAFLPDKCTLLVDVRYLPGMHPDRDVREALEKLKAEDPELVYDLQVTPDDIDHPGMPWENFRLTVPPQDLPADEAVVQAHAGNYEYLTAKKACVGAIAPEASNHFKMYWINDDSVLTQAGTASFCCGPTAGRAANGERYVEIDSMLRVARNFALTAYDICNRDKA